VAFGGNDSAVGVVREVSSGILVVQTPPVRVPETDAQVGAAAWKDASHFVLGIQGEGFGPDRWLRFLGQVGVAALRVDTVTATISPAPSNHGL